MSLTDATNLDSVVKSGSRNRSERVAYPSYKDCEVKWMPTIPVHWSVGKVKHTTYVKGRIGWKGLRSDEFVDDGPFCVTGTDFLDGRICWDRCYHIGQERYNEDPYIQLQNKDLLITKDGSIGKVAVVNDMPGQACLNSGLFVTRPRAGAYRADCMSWVMCSRVFSHFIEYMQSGSTIQHLYQYVFEQFAFPLPPLPEQQAIANFLDRETTKIDALIAKKRRLIGLLQEKWEAVITQAVTRGVNRDTDVHDNAADVSDKIPTRWPMKRLKHLVPNITVGIVVTPAKYYEEVGIPCLRSLNISGGIIDHSNLVFISELSNEMHRKSKIYTDDIVVVRTGKTGTAALVTPGFDGANCIDLVIIRRSKRIRSKYLHYFINSQIAVRQIEAISVGSIQAHYNTSTVGELTIPTPPLHEQDNILAKLDEEVFRIEGLKKEVKSAIEKLTEYRSALISAAVTGKIDVRNQ